MLSKLMLLKSNVLVLDDPTNHLDLESISSLNDGLKAFKESIIFASHDHEFIQTLANHIIVISKTVLSTESTKLMMNSWKMLKYKQKYKNFGKHNKRGWDFCPASLLRVRVNISAQWLIARFVRVSHSKSGHYDCCEQSSPYLQPQTVSQTV